MDIDFTPFFKKYEALAKLADETFDRVKKEHPDCIKCDSGCSDCCHALFDLSLIEAFYINHQFGQCFDGQEKHQLINRANNVDRKIHKIKRQAHKDFEAGKKEIDIMMDMSFKRARCPLLNLNDRCDMYDFRPITCRLYGIPIQIGNMSHTCNLSAFEEGVKYPSAKMDVIHQRLYAISLELAIAVRSKFSKIAEMLVPLSMALLNDYNAEYFGFRTLEEVEKKAKAAEGTDG
ncbi:YkgJ family cysteine cluster protein [Desulfococcaceae bacterium HSG9]|nr:YkgJ family cysteine cluster protein [Desulfococcaceae bacterium HSG9]